MSLAGASTSVRKGLPSLAGTRLPLGLPLGLVPIAALLGWVLASRPDLYRPLFALGTVAVFGLLALRWPKAAILGVLLFLPLLGLFRRLLIESSGWPVFDPLLLIGPALAVVLFVRAYVLDSRSLAPDLLSKLVLAFLALILLGIVNPFGAGLQAGLIAAVLVGVPLLWFFVGRALPDRPTILRLQWGTAFLAAAIAIYGLWQTEVGFPSWDLAWVEVGGYSSLSVGGTLRGWGTMASASEYAGYLGAGIVFAVAALVDRRAWPLVVVPLVGAALVFSSVRGVLILTLLAIAVMMGLRSPRPRVALPLIAVGGVAVYLAAAPVLASVSSSSSSDLVTHQLEGIARPFDEDSSTVDVHLELVGKGFTEGLSHPLGQGVAPGQVSGDAGAATSGEVSFKGAGSEFDFTDAFIRFGFAGGVIFLSLTTIALATAGRHYRQTRDPLLLGAIGLAVMTLGYWLNGGNYALTPLLWFTLGWATRPPESARSPREAARTSP